MVTGIDISPVMLDLARRNVPEATLALVEADVDGPFLGAPVRVTGWPREQLRRVIDDIGFTIEVEDARSYVLPATDAPPETQLFILAHRD